MLQRYISSSQPELFPTFENERRFSTLKAMARGLASEFEPSTHLEEARSFCSQVLHAYWQEKISEVELDWTISPAPMIFFPVGAIAANLANELGKTAAGFESAKAGYLLGTIYTSTLPADIRSKWGAFYTPMPYADHLLDMLDQAGFDWAHGKVIDPACGGGAFLAPVALKMMAANKGGSPEFQLAGIVSRLNGVEIDPFAAWIAHVLLETALLPLCKKAKRRLPNIIHVADALDIECENDFDLVIGNPPYGRITLSSERRDKFSSSLFGHANLYGLFTDLAVRLSRSGGHIAYVTPTSFLGGQYFKALRQMLVKHAPPVSISFIEHREGVFDDVLQETMLSVYQKSNHTQPVSVESLSTDETGSSVTVHNLGRVAVNTDDAPWLLPRHSEHQKMFGRLSLMGARLRDIGYAISTGQLVWNRHKAQLRDTKNSPQTYPLIWAESVSLDGFNFSAERRNHVPYIEVYEKQSHLLTGETCILVQRTTAKEQSRRLIAGVLPKSFIAKHGAVVVENHLNMIYAVGESEITPATIAVLLNSRAVDTVFRCISGSVAVSAYELNALPIPDRSELKSLNRLVSSNADMGLIEKLLNRMYGLTT